MVDTGDLKSPGHYDRAGSSPASCTSKFYRMSILSDNLSNTVDIQVIYEHELSLYDKLLELENAYYKYRSVEDEMMTILSNDISKRINQMILSKINEQYGTKHDGFKYYDRKVI